MKIKVLNKVKSKSGIIVYPVFQNQIKKLNDSYPKAVKSFIKARVDQEEFKGEKGEILSSFLDDKSLPERLILFGLGDSEKFSAKKSRRIGGKVGKSIKGTKSKEATIVFLPELEEYLQEFMEGYLMSQYKADLFKTSDAEANKSGIEKLYLITKAKSKTVNPMIDSAAVIADGVDLVKDLVNSPSNLMDESHMVKTAKQIAKENKYKIKVFGDKELKKMKWGGLLAVNQGSDKQARCIVLQYKGGKSKDKPIALIGKGVIFDTGGYNIKPTNYIEKMHQDMAGAASVLGVFSMLKKLDVKKNVIAVIPIAENLVSSKAYRPADVLTMYSGKTVEITNTDAEGRLILADAITYATEQKPDCIVTIATLTGAVSVALGHRYAGLFSNRNKLRAEMKRAGRKMDDYGWPLPLHADYKKCMDSKIADIRNCDLGTSRVAGSSKAAAFLERFIDGNDWVHIDIGGTAFTKSPKDYEVNGATAHGVRMMLKFVMDH